MVKLGPRGESLIKAVEKFSLTAYKPTPSDVYTIGWGSTRNVHEGMEITFVEAVKRFDDDTREATQIVNTFANELLSLGHKLTQSMVDSLISLVYNEGPSPLFHGNTIGDSLRRGDYLSAWAGFTLWRKQKNGEGKLVDLLGLARRRGNEMNLFLEDGLP